MNILERIQKPTPKIFKQLRTIGLVAASIGGALIAAPIAIPTLLVQIGGYLVVAGGILSGVSQLTVDDAFVLESHSSR